MRRSYPVTKPLSRRERQPRHVVRQAHEAVALSDLIGLGILGCLLCSPLLFKFRLTNGIVLHPFVPLLLAAWGWVAWGSRRTMSSLAQGWYVAEWQAWNLPVLLLGLSVAGLMTSLAVNSIWRASFEKTGLLLLLKWVLYLAPLPLAALLTLRRPLSVIRLVSYLLPSVALGTLCYSAFRLWQALDGRYTNVYTDGASIFFAMGTFAEAWSLDGLSVRSDTMGHTAYGMYLVCALMFSCCLALFRGWNGLVNRLYAAGQVCVLGPLALGGILLSGSRTGLFALAVSLCGLFVLLRLNPGSLLSARRRWLCAALLVLVPLILLCISALSPAALPTVERLQETLAGRSEIIRQVTDEASTVVPDDTLTRQSVRNVQSRLWIWGQSMRYLLAHPGTIIWGIGYDRQRFVETVVGLPYEGANINFQTAHNLFLDILLKGGVGPLLPLAVACAWLFWSAVNGVLIPARGRESMARIGLGWMLIAFWPSVLLCSLAGEELLTDNLLLHWTLLFGLSLGLGGLALSEWLPNRMLHMTARAGIGGGPSYVTALARHQQQAGIHVRVFCSDEQPFVGIWRSMGVDVSVLPMRRPNARSVWHLLKELLRAPAPIHAHGRGAGFFAFWVKLLVRIPVLYTPHGPHYAYARGWRYASAWGMEWLFRLVFDAVLYVSPGEQALAAAYHLPVNRSRVVITGLLAEGPGTSRGSATREALHREWALPPDRFVIGWIGRFDYAKGLDLLLASIPAVAAQLPNAVWVIVGDGDNNGVRRSYQRDVDAALADRVLFLGRRTDVNRLIPGFDLYISTSRWEGLPLVLLEVMEQGIPIVASDVVGNRDVLGGWGVLFAANDIEAAAAAQVRVATDKSLRSQLMETGRHVRQAEFSLSRMLAVLDGVYCDVLGSKISGLRRSEHQEAAARPRAVGRYRAGMPLPG
ncbi:MAG: glycosyltransferase [Nitrospira sp.]